MPRPWRAAQQLMFLTLNTPWEHGDQTTLPNTFRIGLNPRSQTLPYPASQPPTLTYLRSSPYTTPTANRYCPMRDPSRQDLTSRWLYPIPTRPTEPYSGDGHYSNDHEGGSPQSLTPWTPIPRHLASSPSGSIMQLLDPVDLIHFDTIITEGPEDSGTPSIPMVSTTSGPNLPPLTKRSSVQNEPPPGTTGGRTLSAGSSIETTTFASPWSSTSQLPGGIQSRHEEASRLFWPESLPTTNEPYTAQARGPMYETYVPEPFRSRGSLRRPYNLWHNKRTIDSEGSIIEGFHYDPETFGAGYVAVDGEFIQTELPQPMPDSLPNPRRSGYYTGTSMS